MISTDWRDDLICTKSGIPKSLLANAVIALRGAQEWRGVLGFDEFTYQVMLIDVPPWMSWTEAGSFQPRPWTDEDDIAATYWLQKNESISVKPEVTAQAVQLVSRDRSYHPVLEYLGRIEWDGKPRLPAMLSRYYGAEQSQYTEVVGRITMISAVARICDPGCKVDTVLILESEQGLKKSTAIKELFDPWFTDDLEQLGSKDSAMQVAGVWCIEISELDAMNKAEVPKIKAFISRRVDRFRPPYGRRLVERPRTCIFIGTVNGRDYLKDWTGARRFLPVKITKIDIEALRADRDQLWAEACVLYSANVPWWFTEKATDVAAANIAKDEQDARYQADAWEPLIADYLDSRLHQPPASPAYQVDIKFVFQHGLRIEDQSRWDQNTMNRVARCMVRLGWERKQVYARNADGQIVKDKHDKPKRVWKYVRPPTTEELEQDARQEEIIAAKKAGEAGNVTSMKRASPDASEELVTQETAAPHAESPV